jgi:hypothetical protein
MLSGIGYLVVRAFAERLLVQDILFAKRTSRPVRIARSRRQAYAHTRASFTTHAALLATAQYRYARSFSDARACLRDMAEFAPFQRGPSGTLLAGN